MDRAAKLAEAARAYIDLEEVVGNGDRDIGREVTRQRLFWDAADLGFDPLEISAAVDEAIAAASMPTSEGGK